MERATEERDATNRVFISQSQVRVTGEAAPVAPPPRPGECAPRIDLVRNGDRIGAIEILCSCGKRIHLECEY